MDRKGKHPLDGLHGRRLDGLKLHLTWGPKNAFGARYFHLFTQDGHGQLSQQPVVTGLFSSGTEAAYNWVEIVSSSQLITFNPPGAPQSPDRIGVTPALIRCLLRLLSGLVPPGGHFMIEYDSQLWLTTRQALAAGVPPLATPLGSLLYDMGCGVWVRDWYLAEGGREGRRKLWGYKAQDEAHAQARARENAKELLDYLARPPRHGYEAAETAARHRARRLLRKLPLPEGELRKQVRQALSKISKF